MKVPIKTVKFLLKVLKELMKFNKPIVINKKNKLNESTCLHLGNSFKKLWIKRFIWP